MRGMLQLCVPFFLFHYNEIKENQRMFLPNRDEGYFLHLNCKKKKKWKD